MGESPAMWNMIYHITHTHDTMHLEVGSRYECGMWRSPRTFLPLRSIGIVADAALW